MSHMTALNLRQDSPEGVNIYKILKKRIRNGHLEYKCQWTGDYYDSWEHYTKLKKYPQLIQIFEERSGETDSSQSEYLEKINSPLSEKLEKEQQVTIKMAPGHPQNNQISSIDVRNKSIPIKQKGKRGRPSKEKVPTDQSEVKRKRGRPKKNLFEVRISPTLLSPARGHMQSIEKTTFEADDYKIQTKILDVQKESEPKEILPHGQRPKDEQFIEKFEIPSGTQIQANQSLSILETNSGAQIQVAQSLLTLQTFQKNLIVPLRPTHQQVTIFKQEQEKVIIIEQEQEQQSIIPFIKRKPGRPKGSRNFDINERPNKSQQKDKSLSQIHDKQQGMTRQGSFDQLDKLLEILDRRKKNQQVEFLVSWMDRKNDRILESSWVTSEQLQENEPRFLNEYFLKNLKWPAS